MRCRCKISDLFAFWNYFVLIFFENGAKVVSIATFGKKKVEFVARIF